MADEDLIVAYSELGFDWHTLAVSFTPMEDRARQFAAKCRRNAKAGERYLVARTTDGFFVVVKRDVGGAGAKV